MIGVPKCPEGTAIKLAYSPPDGSVFGSVLARQSPLFWGGKEATAPTGTRIQLPSHFFWSQEDMLFEG